MTQPKSVDKHDATLAFLTEMRDAGYELITIGKPVTKEENPACASWQDGPYSIWAYHHSFKGYHNSDDGNRECCIDRWPAVWRIIETYVHGSCGNGHQKQIPEKQEILLDGTYNITDLPAIAEFLATRKEQDFLNSI